VIDPFCMVLEYMALGNLFDLIHKQDKIIDWKNRIRIASDIANGMVIFIL